MVDIILILIIIISACLAGKRGIIKTVAGMFGTIAAYFATVKLVMPWLAPKIATIITPLCTKWLSGIAQKSDVATQVTAPYSQATSSLDSLLAALKIPSTLFSDIGDKLAETGKSILAASGEAIGRELAPIIALLLGFVVIKIAIWFVVKLLSADIPIVRTLNHGAGFLLGAASGILIVIVLCIGLRAFAPQGIAGLLSIEQINASLIAGFIFKIAG